MVFLVRSARAVGCLEKRLVNNRSKTGRRSANYGRWLKRFKMVIGVEVIENFRQIGKTGVDLAVLRWSGSFWESKGGRGGKTQTLY